MRPDLELLQGASDIHIHSAPDVFARLFDHIDIARQARDVGMRAVLMKCHHQGTADRMPLVRRFVTGIDVFGSLNLNHSVGGLNPYAVETAIRYGAKKIFMPTVDARHHAEVTGVKGGYKGIAMEEVGEGNDAAAAFTARPPIEIAGEDGKVKPALYDILDLIATAGIILSCGHLSPPEIQILAAAARERRVRKVVIDHPFWLKIPFTLQEELARAGAWLNYTFMEISPRWWTLPVGEMAEAIGKIGPGRVVISSDAGQLHNPPPAEALRIFIEILLEEGLPPKAIRRMVQSNPADLLYG